MGLKRERNEERERERAVGSYSQLPVIVNSVVLLASPAWKYTGESFIFLILFAYLCLRECNEIGRTEKNPREEESKKIHQTKMKTWREKKKTRENEKLERQ